MAKEAGPWTTLRYTCFLSHTKSDLNIMAPWKRPKYSLKVPDPLAYAGFPGKIVVVSVGVKGWQHCQQQNFSI